MRLGDQRVPVEVSHARAGAAKRVVATHGGDGRPGRLVIGRQVAMAAGGQHIKPNGRQYAGAGVEGSAAHR